MNFDVSINKTIGKTQATISGYIASMNKAKCGMKNTGELLDVIGTNQHPYEHTAN